MTIAERLREAGRRKGKQEGRLEGQRAKAVRIARTLLAEGLALERVLRITGLPKEEITGSR